jgi:hypothetical protein
VVAGFGLTFAGLGRADFLNDTFRSESGPVHPGSGLDLAGLGSVPVIGPMIFD